jgi:hypothetical protein
LSGFGSSELLEEPIEERDPSITRIRHKAPTGCTVDAALPRLNHRLNLEEGSFGVVMSKAVSFASGRAPKM